MDIVIANAKVYLQQGATAFFICTCQLAWKVAAEGRPGMNMFALALVSASASIILWSEVLTHHVVRSRAKPMSGTNLNLKLPRLLKPF